MAVFNVTEAMDLVGRTVLVELAFPDDPETSWGCVRIVGVVFAQDGHYDAPHFMVFNAFFPRPYPDELFWSDINSVLPLN